MRSPAAILTIPFACVLLLPAQQSVDFDAEIRPIIEANCLGCHNPKLRMSGLSLASRQDLLAGGKRGPAVQSGDAGQSALLKAIRHEGNVRMPPGRSLSAQEIRSLERWILNGAPWPQSALDTANAKPNHWAFRPPALPSLPEINRPDHVRSPVDRFILARLEREGIEPSPVAPRETLIRRAYLDLVGLPPTPEQVQSFVNDTRPDAWERLLDSLLASPHYGERWGRRWLDYARYADSDGGSRDEPRQIWRYRDWVIEALNRDMPFDRFVIEQLAGDLLDNPTESQLIATGFHRNAPIQIEAGTDREQYRTEAVFDRTDVTGTVFLGLSVGCAKCHDHKYDPISQKEYYRLFAFFNSSDDWGSDRPRFNPKAQNLHDVHRPLIEFAARDVIRSRDELSAQILELDERVDELRKEPGHEEEVKRINARIAEIRKQIPTIEASMIMRELPQPRPTHVLLGGDFLAKGEAVTPGVPSFLHPLADRPGANRLDLARWLVDPANPLLARVTVNRIWQEYFGRGLVETENDFGTQGTPPTHPELLDWLAAEFIRSGWSQKHIHRLIATSSTYRQSSRSRSDLEERDPRNLLLARQSRLRLDAEIVRDVALGASGMLVPKVGGPSVFPPQPAAAMSASQVKKTWTASTGEDRYRRGMYTYFWRVTPNPALIVFDAPGATFACTRRTRSNTPLQALTLLNELSFHEFYQGFAARVLREAGPAFEDRLGRAFRLALSREPRPKELKRLRALYAAERDALLTHPPEAESLAGAASPAGANRTEMAAWVAIARVLMNTDEFMTRE
ncbi:MAG: DUF1553 domain-containing protein [Bryobacteraceae bacterium]